MNTNENSDPKGFEGTIIPLGKTKVPVNEELQHIYETSEVYENVTIVISKCKHCGKTTIGWLKQPDTKDITDTFDDTKPLNQYEI